MNVSELAEFLGSLGHRIVETESCFWYSTRKFFFKSLPFHKTVSPSSDEVTSVLKRGPAIALRYPGAVQDEVADGGLYICSRADFDFQSLSANVRSHTRRGLARCEIRRVDFDYLARFAFPLLSDTTLRQTGGRPERTLSQWKHFCKQATLHADIEGWGAFVGDQLAAFIVGIPVDDCYYIHVQKSASSLLKYYPNNALLFSVTKTKLRDGGFSCISHGQIALAAKEGLYHFKTSMGFEVIPFKEHVAFNPLLRAPVQLGRRVVNAFERHYPKNLFWRRASRSISLSVDKSRPQPG